MPECPHLSTCALFPLLTLRTTLKVWRQNYCESDFERCARYQKTVEGQLVPLNLLPNGDTLRLPPQKGPRP